ncbi:hypothetical protein RI129_003449 [Pyrocoelia pectoralis]|uniref:Uncharacterized protein n=1 Tax=Pyrocoelia pectoralis TaxID=417401 RepID=A0AAN7ZN80_9COLE
MDEMDVDLDDIGQDPIQRFLLHKLNEIQLNNDELEQQINRRRELISACLEKVASGSSQNMLNVTSVWHKRWNGKWVIGIEVTNSGSIGVVKNICATLKLDSSTSFTYHTNIFCRYKHFQQDSQLHEPLKTIVSSLEKRKTDTKGYIENEWKKTTEISKSATIVISFPIPDLLHKSQFDVNGVISYEYKSKHFQLTLSPITIALSDLTNKKYDIKNFEILSGNDQVYLTLLSCSKQHWLVAKCNQMSINLENRLEFDCRFKRVNVTSKSMSVYLVDDICDSCNGILITVEKEKDLLYNLVIYSRDFNSYELMLHYIYEQIPDLLMIPKSKQHILQEEIVSLTQQTTQSELVQKKLKKLGTVMEAQLLLVQQFCDEEIGKIPPDALKKSDDVEFNIRINNYQTFRHKLSDFEQKADFLYNSINKSKLFQEKEEK